MVLDMVLEWRALWHTNTHIHTRARTHTQWRSSRQPLSKQKLTVLTQVGQLVGLFRSFVAKQSTGQQYTQCLPQFIYFVVLFGFILFLKILFLDIFWIFGLK